MAASFRAAALRTRWLPPHRWPASAATSAPPSPGGTPARADGRPLAPGILSRAKITGKGARSACVLRMAHAPPLPLIVHGNILAPIERDGGVSGLLDDILPSAEYPPMRFPWQAREYERTCLKCGYTWRVPRSAARRRRRTISMFSVASPRTIDRAELGREVASISAENQRTEAFRECPKCGAVRFTQRSLHSEAPSGFAD